MCLSALYHCLLQHFCNTCCRVFLEIDDTKSLDCEKRETAPPDIPNRAAVDSERPNFVSSPMDTILVPPRDNFTVAEARYVSLIWHDCPSSEDPLVQELTKFCLSESTAACVSLAQLLARDSPVVHRSSLARLLIFNFSVQA